MSPTSVSGYYDLLACSRLLSADQLRNVLPRWQAKAGSAVEDLEAFSRWAGELKPFLKKKWEQVVAGRPSTGVTAELGMTLNAVYLRAGQVLSRLRQTMKGLLD